ncbi:MAG: metal ABC transporter ATP-binding protein [Acidimicrobiia bacterium]|nr:metal ABC transporter ATP-binding protein [Acidimicrobiia bacterium]
MPLAVRGSGVTLIYGDRIVFRASDFVIPAGEITAVIGPNGSGKSTLLNAIAGLASLADGSLEVLGTDPEGARSQTSYVLQATKVNERLPVTVREVVMMSRYVDRGVFGFVRKPDRQIVDEALDRLDVAHLAVRHLSELSGGERQRVFVAQGLAQRADLLLLDEPLNALDLVSKNVIIEAIEGERERGRTVIATTHDLSEAARAGHVLLLAGGVVAEGPPAETLTAPNLARAYGIEIVEDASGAPILDDSAHNPVDERHQHFDRTGHAEH